MASSHCGCTCMGDGGHRSPSFRILWGCKKCKSKGFYLPECNYPDTRGHKRERDVYVTRCLDPERFESDRRWSLHMKNKRSRETILKRASASRDVAKRHIDAAKKAKARAKLYEEKAEKAPPYEPYIKARLTCRCG